MKNKSFKKAMIWLVESGKIIVLHVQHALYFQVTFSLPLLRLLLKLPNWDGFSLSNMQIWGIFVAVFVNNDLIGWIILTGWMRKTNRAARAARTLVQFFDVVCQMTTWNFPIQGFNRQREDTTVNPSVSIFTLTELLLGHLQRALSTIKDARKMQ